MPGSRWTTEEVELLKSVYCRTDFEIKDVASLFPNRSAMACHLKARSLGLFKNWSQEEEELLREWYLSPAVTVREICRRFKRNKKAIYNKAHFMGLRRHPEQNRAHPWSEMQISFLTTNWDKSSGEIRSLIPLKSGRAISAMAKKLGLPKRAFGDGFTRRERRNWSDRRTYILEDSMCAVSGCVGWENVLDVHHESDGSILVLCPGHHAMITRKHAKIIDGTYTLL